MGKEENELLKMAMSELNFSARAYDKILKVSRTIADLVESEEIKNRTPFRGDSVPELR